MKNPAAPSVAQIQFRAAMRDAQLEQEEMRRAREAQEIAQAIQLATQTLFMRNAVKMRQMLVAAFGRPEKVA